MLSVLIAFLLAIGMVVVVFLYTRNIGRPEKPVTVCHPNCSNKSCKNDDGCGKPCPCPTEQKCSSDGTCVPATCTPSCTGNCGPDGCGGLCGNCPNGSFCNGTCKLVPPVSVTPDATLAEGKYLIQGASDSWLTIENDSLIFKQLPYQNPSAVWVFKNGRLTITSEGDSARDYALTRLSDGAIIIELVNQSSVGQTGWVLRDNSIMNWIFFMGISSIGSLTSHVDPESSFTYCRPIPFV